MNGNADQNDVDDDPYFDNTNSQGKNTKKILNDIRTKIHPLPIFLMTNSTYLLLLKMQVKMAPMRSPIGMIWSA